MCYVCVQGSLEFDNLPQGPGNTMDIFVLIRGKLGKVLEHEHLISKNSSSSQQKTTKQLLHSISCAMTDPAGSQKFGKCTVA